MPELEIQPARTPAEIRTFLEFPWTVYRGNAFWVPPLINERLEFVDPQRNPFFQHARAQLFLARRRGTPVGTIAAFTNQRYNEFQGTNLGFFGFFEVLEDPEAAHALLATAETWARGAGHTAVLGPAQWSTNDECGLLIDGFDDRPRILMTYNPPRYKDYLESAGYTKAMDLWAYELPLSSFGDSVNGMPPKLLRVADKVLQSGKFTIRKLNMKDFEAEVDRLKGVYNRSWEKNWGFVPMNDAEFDHLGKNLRQMVDPDLVILVEHEGQMAGFGLSLPDLNQPLRLAYPRPGTPEAWTMVKMAWHWKVRPKLDWLRVFALGVLPEFRGQGVDALMYVETARAAFRKGYKWAEMSWILENNMMMNRAIQFLGGQVYKTYRFYQKSL